MAQMKQPAGVNRRALSSGRPAPLVHCPRRARTAGRRRGPARQSLAYRALKRE
jgi:hypothetical protein